MLPANELGQSGPGSPARAENKPFQLGFSLGVCLLGQDNTRSVVSDLRIVC